MPDFDGLSAVRDAARPRGAVGKRAYAIGDIHGCHDLLLDLLDQIQSHATAREALETHIIFLGDLIDRGPDSNAVVEFLRSYDPDFATCHFISGNHEEILVRIYDGDSDPLPMWLAHGGWQTLKSYGVNSRDFRELTEAEALALIRETISREHVDFMKSFDDGIEFGDFFLTHAGVRPGIPIAEQAGHDLRWIRKGFLDSEEDLGAVIVHGHTVADDITIRSNRIGIDTGAYISGKLSALWIEETELGVLSAQLCSAT